MRHRRGYFLWETFPDRLRLQAPPLCALEGCPQNRWAYCFVAFLFLFCSKTYIQWNVQILRIQVDEFPHVDIPVQQTPQINRQNLSISPESSPVPPSGQSLPPQAPTVQHACFCVRFLSSNRMFWRSAKLLCTLTHWITCHSCLPAVLDTNV